MPLSGHCLCKAVTYTVDIDAPLLVGYDHCDDCQRQSGSTYCRCSPWLTPTVRTKHGRTMVTNLPNSSSCCCPQGQTDCQWTSQEVVWNGILRQCGAPSILFGMWLSHRARSRRGPRNYRSESWYFGHGDQESPQASMCCDPVE